MRFWLGRTSVDNLVPKSTIELQCLVSDKVLGRRHWLYFKALVIEMSFYRWALLIIWSNRGQTNVARSTPSTSRSIFIFRSSRKSLVLGLEIPE